VSGSANNLYFGDNLEILRNEIKSESVDLIYLDPPFNSKANYNRLFRTPKGHEPHAQVTAFEDTWRWGEQAEREFAELILQPNTDVSEMMQALRRFLGENDVMAYLTMMANRLLELHRVLKPTGSLYLHCDPTASHYLKIVLDGIFGKENFQNEVVWKRTFAHSSAKRYGPVHDVIFFYSRSDEYTWNKEYQSYDPAYLETFFDRTDEDGRRWMRMDLTGDGIRHGDSGEPWRGINVTVKGRHWAVPIEAVEQYKLAPSATSQQKLDALDAAGAIHWPKKEGGVPRLKRYADKSLGVPLQDVWNDIRPLHNLSSERLGYPTQKPLQLLERIIQSSSNPGDVILDPFCGCGTAIHGAEKLKRKWIGIDITNLAISLVEERLLAAFPGITFDVHGTPKDLDSACDLAQRDKYEFQWWACSLVNAQPYQGKKKGADSGIDGVIYFKDDKTIAKKIIVSVKAGEHVSVPMIRDLGHVINREKASLGLFVTLTKPTAPMRVEAVKAGYYQSPVGPKSKIQILTVEGLLAGTEKPDYFDLMQGALMTRKPARELDAIQLGFDSAAYLSEVPTTEETPRKPARVARAAKPRKASRKTA
jgi:DNA modification methylase